VNAGTISGARSAGVDQRGGRLTFDALEKVIAQAVAEACRVGSDGAPTGYEWLFTDPQPGATIPRSHRLCIERS
jgi:hypothetical protein